MPEAFAAVDWYDAPGDRGRVAVIPGRPDYDPRPLVGQLVTINGVPYFVKGVETFATATQRAGASFGLLVEQRG